MPIGTMIATRTRESRMASRRSLRRSTRSCEVHVHRRTPCLQRPSSQLDEDVLQRSLLRVDRQHVAVLHPGREPLGVARVVEPHGLLLPVRAAGPPRSAVRSAASTRAAYRAPRFSPGSETPPGGRARPLLPCSGWSGRRSFPDGSAGRPGRESRAPRRVETAGRLVEKEQLRAVHQRSRHQQALLHAARVGLDLAARPPRRQLDHVEQFVHPAGRER